MIRLTRYGSVAALALLAACDSNSVADTLGMSRAAPDEFTVVSRPPLSLPPEFNLRPPAPGEPPLGQSTKDIARETLIGRGAAAQATDSKSTAADAFLKRAGADAARDDIRTLLGKDDRTPVDTSKAGSLLEKLQLKENQNPVVDAAKESERLRDNKDKGKPINEGEVPVEKGQLPSLVDRIF